MPGAAVVRFTHLLAKNWRNFPRVDVSLGGRVILAGPSAAGKSNFLDIFRFLGDLAAPGLGFQESVRMRGGVRRLRCLAARQNSDLGLVVHAGAGLNPTEWEYELHFNQDDQPLPFIKGERLSRCGEDLVLRPDENDAADPERLCHTALEQGGLHKEWRDFAAFLRTVRYVNPIPQLMREPGGSAILDQMAATPERSRQARLRMIQETLQGAVPQLMQLEAVRDSHGRPHLRALYEHWRPRGAWQSEDQLADGTLRLIGLLWAVLDGNGPLLIEEPETSLHPQIVRLLPKMLSRRSARQTFLTTHSPDLLCGEDVETAEILILNPHEEGTTIRPAFDLQEAADLLDRGILAIDAREPADDRQMNLFGTD